MRHPILAGLFGLFVLTGCLTRDADESVFVESSIGEGVALAVTAGGLAALLPTLGIMGAGITSLLAYSASSAFMVRRVSQALAVSPATLLKPERGAVPGGDAYVESVSDQ